MTKNIKCKNLVTKWAKLMPRIPKSQPGGNTENIFPANEERYKLAREIKNDCWGYLKEKNSNRMRREISDILDKKKK